MQFTPCLCVYEEGFNPGVRTLSSVELTHLWRVFIGYSNVIGQSSLAHKKGFTRHCHKHQYDSDGWGTGMVLW